MEMKNLHLFVDAEEKGKNINDISSSSGSTPFVSAPSSPGRTGGFGFFYSAPASPMHFLLSANNSTLTPPPPPCAATEDEFDFDASCYPMSSADELFFNGQIRPMQHKRHQLDVVQEVSDDHHPRGRLELRNRSLRRVRSEEQFQYNENDDDDDDDNNDNNDNDNSSGKKKSDDVQGRPWLLRNSKRWVSLFLYRSKSEGRNNERHKYFWSSVVKHKKSEDDSINNKNKNKQQQEEVGVKEDKTKTKAKKQMKMKMKTKTRSGESCSNSEVMGLWAHYTANRAQSEEMRKKTYLPYRQGIFGCIGLNPRPGPPASFNAFAARALNSVSS